MQEAHGIPTRPVPELRALETMQDFWRVWDKGSRNELPLKDLDEKLGIGWRRDAPGDKAKNNSKRW